MQLEEFSEKYLPEFKAKREIFFKIHKMSDEGATMFLQTFFPEALQNFTNEICEKQRLLCCDAIEDCEHGYEIGACENAKQPEIEEL